MAERRYLPALRGVFGDWRYYSCLMRMEEVVERVGFAEEVYKNKGLSDMVQRALKGKRAKQIFEYLKNNDQRFFNSLVVAVIGGDPNWHGFSDFKPLKDDFDPDDLGKDIRDKVGFLSFDGTERMFALDGQHRLAGMRLSVEKGIPASSESVSLIFVAHKESPQGLIRTRNLFTTLNKTAVPVGKGERIALDESDVMAIVARHLVEETTSLGGEKILITARDNLPASDKAHLTTIGNIYEVLSEVFARIRHKKSKTELKYKRPTEEEVAQFIEYGEQYFADLGDRFPEVREFLASKEPGRVIAKYRKDTGGHVLFRPAGLRMIAEVVGHLVSVEGLDYYEAMDRVALVPVSLAKDPYKGILWIGDQRRMNTAKRPLCRQVLLYMLGASKRLPVDLRERYVSQPGEGFENKKLPSRLV